MDALAENAAIPARTVPENLFTRHIEPILA